MNTLLGFPVHTVTQADVDTGSVPGAEQEDVGRKYIIVAGTIQYVEVEECPGFTRVTARSE